MQNTTRFESVILSAFTLHHLNSQVNLRKVKFNLKNINCNFLKIKFNFKKVKFSSKITNFVRNNSLC